MIWCSCGELIIDEIGDGFVITPKADRKWLRRRSDYFQCPHCERRFVFEDLKQLTHTAPSSS